MIIICLIFILEQFYKNKFNKVQGTCPTFEGLLIYHLVKSTWPQISHFTAFWQISYFVVSVLFLLFLLKLGIGLASFNSLPPQTFCIHVLYRIWYSASTAIGFLKLQRLKVGTNITIVPVKSRTTFKTLSNDFNPCAIDNFQKLFYSNFHVLSRSVFSNSTG